MESQQEAGTASSKGPKRLWSAHGQLLRRNPERLDAQKFSDLMVQCRDRWLRSSERADLDAAISYAEKAVATLPSGHHDRVSLLKALWTGLFTRFRHFSQNEDLDAAVRCEWEALELIQEYPSTIHEFEEIGVGFYLRFQMNEALSDLDDAIMCGETVVVALREDERTDYHKQLGSVAVRLSQRYTKRGALINLDHTIEYIKDAISFAPEGDINTTSYLGNLVTYLGFRYEEKLQEEDLNRAVSLGQKLLDTMTVSTPDQSNYLTNIGNVLHTIFLRNGHLGDLKQAVECGQQALETSISDDPDHSNHVAALGVHHRALYWTLGEFRDLEKSLDYLNTAVAAARRSHDRASHLSNQAMVLRDMYNVNNRNTHLDRATAYGLEALDELDTTRNRIKCLHHLGVAQTDRFERDGVVSDLDTAEGYVQQALEELPTDQANSAASHSTLSDISRRRFYVTGSLTYLRKAIHYGEKAVSDGSKKDPAYSDYLANQSANLMSLYGRTGHVVYIEQAIEHCETALSLVPPTGPKAAQYLYVLSTALTERYRREDSLNILDQAIVYGEQAQLQAHVHRPEHMLVLAQRYRVRFKREKNISDLQKAMHYHKTALRSASEANFEYPRCLSGMSKVCHIHYKHTRHGPSLSDAITHVEKAIDRSPIEDPERAALYNSLGFILFDHELEACRSRPLSPKDMFGASAVYLQALNCSTSYPIDRLVGGYLAAMGLATIDDYTGAKEAIVQTLNLIPLITFPTNSREDLQHTLPKISGLGILAASLFYKCGRSPLDAIYASEDSRGTISSLRMNVRSTTSLLKDRHPDLWLSHCTIQDEIETLKCMNSSSYANCQPRRSTPALHQQLQDLYSRLENTRKDIRSRAGFSRFLLSPSEQDMHKLAEKGDIVCLNSSFNSSEAFLITSKRMWVMPLPDLLLEDTEFLTLHLARMGNSSRRDASFVDDDEEEQIVPSLSLSEKLKLLWTAAVKPILQELGHLSGNHSNDKDMGSLPRVWWVGHGKLGFAPVHAAGDHTSASTENTLSHVLSSYAASLRALQFVQEKSSQTKRDLNHNMMLVSMPKTPGHEDLNVKDEVTAIRKSVDSWTPVISLEYPSKRNVLSALETCTLAHFACHGMADRVDPSKSALLVGQGKQIEKLTVEDLDDASSACAQVVYLSACSTAENKVEYLVDEDIHLASSFQLLGFPHVICTLWGADDDASVQVAKLFYEQLRSYGNWSDGSIAEILHVAVLGYRNSEENITELAKWAPFIHLGC